MPFFYSISLFCSVIGFYWINGNRFHGYLNAVSWPVGEEITVCSVEGEHLGLGSILQGWGHKSHYLVHFKKLVGWGHLSSGSLLVFLKWQLQMEMWNVCQCKQVGCQEWDFSMIWKNNSVPNHGTVQKLKEDHTIPSKSHLQDGGEQEKNNTSGSQRFVFNSSFSTASELIQPSGKLFKLCLKCPRLLYGNSDSYLIEI